MKYICILTLIVVLFAVSGCDTSSGPVEIPRSGTATLDSKIINGKVKGFSFSHAGIVLYPTGGNIIPDFGTLVQITENGEIIGIFLAPVDTFRLSFFLAASISDPDSAAQFFRQYSEAPESGYNHLAIPVNIHQIWVVKTADSRFGKILIKNTVAFEDTTNPSAPVPYGEVTFDWIFQPDGSRFFR